MPSIFETRRAVFDPLHVSRLQDAMRDALAALSSEGPLALETKRRLGKVIVHLARDSIGKGGGIGDDLGLEAASVIADLRSLALLP